MDQKGEKVRRLKEEQEVAPLPSAGAFNRLYMAERARLVETSFAKLRRLGVSDNLAPVAELNFNPSNPDMGALERSFSVEPEAVRENVEIFSRATEACGIGLCLKHYPGLGGVSVNGHENTDRLAGPSTMRNSLCFTTLSPIYPERQFL